MPSNAQNAIIVGAGPCGLYTALTLHQNGIKSTIYELRPQPSTIGGAVNLTPVAIRLLEAVSVSLDDLGCPVSQIEIYSLHSGKRLGLDPYPGPDGTGAGALRILRKDLQQAMIKAVKKVGISVEFGAKLVGVSEDDHGVTAMFEDGKTATADFLLGCDGVHSAVRRSYVDPSRQAKYTQISTAYATIPRAQIQSPLHFDTTSFNTSAKGSILISLYTRAKEDLYFAALMSTPEEGDRQGWVARGADREATLKELRRRFNDVSVPCVKDMVKAAEEVDFLFYPIFCLSAGGQWQRGRVLLLGDAAHAMPPQGESTGLAFEDGALLGKVFNLYGKTKPLAEVFQVYERTRRPGIDIACSKAEWGWKNVADSSWLVAKMMEWLTGWYLWWTSATRIKDREYDIRTKELVL